MTRIALRRWFTEDIARFAASLTFYTVLSLAPTFIIVTAVASSAVGEPAARAALSRFLESRLGPDGAQLVLRVGEAARNDASGPLLTALGILALVFGSTIAFAEIHAGLNKIWRVEGRAGWFGLLRGRFMAFLMVVGLGLLLLASAVTSTMLEMASSVVEDLTGGGTTLVSWTETIVSFLLAAVAFAAVFKFVPDVRIRWRDVWVGSLITAGLFSLGRILIGTYLATRASQSVYGAAAAFVAFLFWTYYSAQVFFFGAEWTHTYIQRHRPKHPGVP